MTYDCHIYTDYDGKPKLARVPRKRKDGERSKDEPKPGEKAAYDPYDETWEYA